MRVDYSKKITVVLTAKKDEPMLLVDDVGLLVRKFHNFCLNS